MAANGWYPDPAGAPDTYRYWDGRQWSAETTGNPRTPPPASAAAAGSAPAAGPTRAGAQPRRASRSVALVVVALIILVATAIVGGVILFGHRASDISGPDEPTSTTSSYDDSSPFPTATPTPTPSASPTPTDSAAPPPQSVPCPQEDTSPGVHPADGRVHGGRLSFAQVDSYPAPEADGQFSWMTDVTSQTQSTEPGWISIFAVGQVLTEDDGFATPKKAAESSIQCAITEGWYSHFAGRRNLRNSAVTIDGHQGWIISAEIRVDEPSLSVAGDQLTFVVIDDGRTDALSVWCGMAPIGDTNRLAINDTVLAGLRVG